MYFHIRNHDLNKAFRSVLLLPRRKLNCLFEIAFLSFRFLEILVPVLINVAFITLIERKILGLSQLRRGPNKVALLGLLQPFRDAVKLFTKSVFFLFQSNVFLYVVAPVRALTLIITL